MWEMQVLQACIQQPVSGDPGKKSRGNANPMTIGRALKSCPKIGFDPSDRKFLAVAVAAEAVVLNATDSDWGEHEPLMDELGVEVKQLCPQHAKKPPRGVGEKREGGR